MNDSPYVTLTVLGEIYGVSASEVGRWLKGMGYRLEDGRPSREAIQGGFVRERGLDHGGYFWTWHREKTTHELDMMGYPRGGPPPMIEEHDGFVLFRG